MKPPFPKKKQFLSMIGKMLSRSQRFQAPLGQYDSGLADRWWERATDKRTRRLTEAAILYRASLKLPEDTREDFISSISDDKSEARELALKLLVSKPADNLNAEGNLRLMSSLKPTETFMLTMKLAFFAGIIVSFPFLLYFLLSLSFRA
jgi:hypothetical protein